MRIHWGNDLRLIPGMVLGLLVGLQRDAKDGVHLMPTLFNVWIKPKHLIQQVITLIPDHLLADILVTRKGQLDYLGILRHNFTTTVT